MDFLADLVKKEMVTVEWEWAALTGSEEPQC